MLDRSQLPKDVPEEVIQAMQVFTDEELLGLSAYYEQETNLFWGIGFIGPGGKVTKYANPDKYAAMMVMEDEIRKELGHGR